QPEATESYWSPCFHPCRSVFVRGEFDATWLPDREDPGDSDQAPLCCCRSICCLPSATARNHAYPAQRRDSRWQPDVWPGYPSQLHKASAREQRRLYPSVSSSDRPTHILVDPAACPPCSLPDTQEQQAPSIVKRKLAQPERTTRG